MPLTQPLPNFPLSEFKHPELIDVRAAHHLQRVRTAFGHPMILTDDARPPGDIPPGGSATSLHFSGRAFDIRSRDWDAETLWHFVAAAQMVALLIAAAERGLELELVASAADHHVHVGFFLDGRPDRLLVRAD